MPPIMSSMYVCSNTVRYGTVYSAVLLRLLIQLYVIIIKYLRLNNNNNNNNKFIDLSFGNEYVWGSVFRLCLEIYLAIRCDVLIKYTDWQHIQKITERVKERDKRSLTRREKTRER